MDGPPTGDGIKKEKKRVEQLQRVFLWDIEKPGYF